MYILDSDAFSEYNRNGQQTVLGRRLADIPNPEESLFLTIVNVEEALAGRLASIRNPRRPDQLHLYYRYFQETYEETQKYQVLPFDEAAQEIYERRIPRDVKEGRKNDCRIAAIALVHDMTVITLNVQDFSRIRDACGVRFEDWSIAIPL